MNIREAIIHAAAVLKKSGTTSPRLDAEVLLSSCLKSDRLELFRHPERMLSVEELSRFEGMTARRLKGEPVAYITGEKEFWSLLFKVNRHVLVPRPETEILVEETIKICGKMALTDIRILEIGVGSGAVSISLAGELPEARFTATDISEDALIAARENAAIHGVGERIDFLCGDLFKPVSGIYDVIVSNPPYISAEELERLPRGVKEYEPKQALLTGADGVAFHRKIIDGGGTFLRKGGWLLMEMGDGQKEDIEDMLKKSGIYDSIEVRHDYGGVERAIKARKA